ncbi:glycosyltransferase family 2 protein [Streptomyces sp. NBC_01142]|uniref:glycosyltransferase family 2 protein n=1 Tax=Streptomyces sp. NBC_01142 TaxID=2975865 RepID=UPI002256643A|nr:glycosyltransferase family 2 protein [Streptomyces sp. NBC_01142]MCX4824570.1 glycosyltransferase family 2 protein [Streptomyces sp. NBC_01142]
MNAADTPGPDVVLSVCRDEEDVIEAFVRFHLDMGFDAVYIVDNGSTDRTVEILLALADEGLPVHLRFDHRVGYDRYLTDHYHWAGEHSGARWLFFLDCDEYVYFPHGAKHLLDRIDPQVNLIRLPQRQMFQDTLEADGGIYSFLGTTTCSIGFGDEPSKVVSRYTAGAKVYGGKHRIDVPGACETSPPDLFIRHFKYRSVRQARTKEINRVDSEQVFTDDDLRELSAFDPTETRNWIEESRQLAAAEHWRTWFSPQWPTTYDDVLARWVNARTGNPTPAFPGGTASHPVPEERLLLHETLRRAVGADGELRLHLRGGSPDLRERLNSEPAVVLCDEEKADGILLAAPDPAAIGDVVAIGLRDPRERRWILTAAPHPEQDALVAAVRRESMHAAVFGADYYGAEQMRQCGALENTAVLSVVPHPHGRAENGVLSGTGPVTAGNRVPEIRTPGQED